MAAPGSLPPDPLSAIAEEPRSNKTDPVGVLDTEPVMAESSTQDVVNQALSVGDASPADVSATNNHSSATGGDEGKKFSGVQEHNANEMPRDFPNGGPVKPVDANTASAINDFTTFDRSVTPSDATYVNGSSILHDGSCGSDTETSRNDSAPTTLADSAGAMKKTASFKPVSFAKYSVTKVVSAASTTKVASEKGPLSTTSSVTPQHPPTRPRLIAKSGSGLRDSAKAYKVNGKSSTGPDPMQVWNKNRAIPPPSTKHLTDEELKQQYGIHMTSRIQADGDGKEAKWADIDDDEDDWAPDTIEWNDGTKISLDQELPTPLKESKPTLPPAEKAKMAPPKNVLASQVTNSVGPNATILKVGQNAEKQAKAVATQPKGPTDKSTSGTGKMPAPPPVKSPWASLPPVTKSPITTNPDPVGAQPRGYFTSPGQHNAQQLYTQSPAQEISADDFNRNWRDAQSSGPRELYMPNSGRYEAVSEGRRRPSRNETHLRQPSVLQRPSGTAAEPSAAFQTSRMSVDQERGPWSRRRASSNVSGGSGQYGRRASVTRGSDFSKPQSVVPHHYQAHQGPPRGMSPAQFSHDSPRLSHVSSEAIASPATIPQEQEVPVEPMEDAVTVQKRVMAEKREAARKRRQEEEEREEAAKKERIRIKLEALGPAPIKLAEKSNEAISAPSAEPNELQIKPADDSTTAASHSPPKPPVPEASGEPKQYGMMKVHHPDSVKKMVPHGQQSAHQQQSLEHLTAGQQSIPPIHEVRSDPLRPTHPSINGLRQSSDDVVRQLDKASDGLSRDRNVRSWNDGLGNGQVVSPWGGARVEQQVPKGSVWGSANNALGNGTFDRSLAEFGGLRGQLPPPVQGGRPTLWAHERSPFPGVEPTQFSHSAIGHPEAAQTVPSLPSPHEQPLAADSEIDSMPPTSRPMPIGPPQQPQAIPGAPGSRVSTTGVAAWNNFHNVAAREDRATNEAYRLDEETKGGRQQAQVSYQETWRQVDPGDQAGQRQVINVSRSTALPTANVAPFSAVGSSVQDLIVPKPSSGVNSSQRASRFFPSGGSNGLLPQDRRAATFSHPTIPSSPSPPPPEELGHPAFVGDVHRPQVSLPKPKAVVKFPPKEQLRTPDVKRLTPPPQSWSAVVGSRAVSTPVRFDAKQQLQPSWQSKINALLEKKGAVLDKKQALAGFSSTKDVLDVSSNTRMTVSLPASDPDSLVPGSKVTTKDVEEEDEIFEDRVAGSLPVVKVPLEVSALVMQPLPPPRQKGRFIKNIDPFSVKFYSMENAPAEKNNVVIHLPGGYSFKKSVAARRSELGSSGSKTVRHGHPSRGRNPPRSRESSGNFKHKGPAGQQTPGSAHMSSPRTGFSSHHSSGWKGSRPSSGISH